MKTLRQLSAATILSLILAVSVSAGQVESPGAKPPTNTTTQTTDVTTSILLTVLSLIYR